MLPGRGLQVKALSWEPCFFQSLVHSRLAPGGGSSEGTSAPRPSSAGEGVTSGSSREPLSTSPQCWRPGVAMETGIGARPPPIPHPRGTFQFQQSCAVHLLALGATSSSPELSSLG